MPPHSFHELDKGSQVIRTRFLNDNSVKPHLKRITEEEEEEEEEIRFLFVFEFYLAKVSIVGQVFPRFGRNHLTYSTCDDNVTVFNLTPPC